ncbi:MAG: Ldh family oxidoreductase [Clostridia bacterium]|nr:Ldh family oxidoreductase [Clostridia bacterium]
MAFDFQERKKAVEAELTARGVSAEQAETVADCFVTADAYGVTTHGTAVLSAHLSRIQNNGYNLTPAFKILRETAAFAVIDGDNAMGPVSATYCMKYAMERCKKSGIFTVFSRNNNTFGPAFYYPLLAAREGLIGIAYSNSPAQMAPIGGKEKLLGTNPFSIVVPNGDEPIILDMATSVVAKSKFKEYKAAGKPLPEGWALDKDGKPTTDPDEAMQGLVLPMAGFKGYGIAMMIDILSGVLSGAAYLNKVGRFYTEDGTCMNVGFNFIAIDPKQILGEAYDEVIKDFVKTIRESEAVECGKICLPGDDRREYFKKQGRKK